MAISIVPGSFVSIITAGRHQPIKDIGKIFPQSWLEFDRTHRSRASHIKYVSGTNTDSTFRNDRTDFRRDVLK